MSPPHDNVHPLNVYAMNDDADSDKKSVIKESFVSSAIAVRQGWWLKSKKSVNAGFAMSFSCSKMRKSMRVLCDFQAQYQDCGQS